MIFRRIFELKIQILWNFLCKKRFPLNFKVVADESFQTTTLTNISSASEKNEEPMDTTIFFEKQISNDLASGDLFENLIFV